MSAAQKRKVGTILDVSLLKSLKLQAVEENRPMADIIANAIELYLQRENADVIEPIGFRKLLKHPALRASYKDVPAVLEEDTY